MSDVNPYGDEPYRTAWDHGFLHGREHPADADPSVPDLSAWGYDAEVTGWLGQVWREGAGAGRAASTGPGVDDGVELPADLRVELGDLPSRFPTLAALASAADVDDWMVRVLGVTDLPGGSEAEV